MSALTKIALDLVGQLKPERPKARGAAPSIVLPPPATAGGMPLAQALAARRSRREFRPDPLPPQVLSDLLWCAFGVNRPESRGRTAPTAHDAQEIDIYAALPSGLYRYDAFAHALVAVAAVDARRITGFQDFVDDAPLDLVYVADHASMTTVPSHRRLCFAAIAAGAMVQNVYLYCAAAGLATVVRGWFDAATVGRALGLGEHESERVLIAQTVGYPA